MATSTTAVVDEGPCPYQRIAAQVQTVAVKGILGRIRQAVEMEIRRHWELGTFPRLAFSKRRRL
jgi:hypothetical protein